MALAAKIPIVAATIHQLDQREAALGAHYRR
jgi:hypothetical protein